MTSGFPASLWNYGMSQISALLKRLSSRLRSEASTASNTDECFDYIATPVENNPGMLEIEVTAGRRKGEKVLVAEFPTRAAYYEVLKDKEVRS